MKKILLSMLLLAALGTLANAQKLGKFGADIGKKSIMGKEIRIPYTSVTSYYGYVGGDTKPDEEKGGKKYYYIYVWIPVAAPELGIRMISPVPDGEKPSATDFISSNFEKNAADKASYFDTWIAFDKASGIFSSADIKSKAKSATWNTIDRNDDSSEMPANPSGSKYNSLMRLTSELSDPMRALTVGLYRIGFTTFKTGDVKGGFMAQIGSPINMPGMVVASSLDDLQTKLAAK
ncbi:MAG: LipL32 family surface lipoprotein [Pyrinomonadaceae bacterium]